MTATIVFDMETGDPDDVMALAVLATHPRVDLRAVTVFPGGRDQVGLVRSVLDRLGRTEVPIGAGTPKKEAPRVGTFYNQWLGKTGEVDAEYSATEILCAMLDPGVTLLTGAALTNVHNAWLAGAEIDRWVCQGGFAGDSVVPEDLRLEKFKGRETCPTYNLNGNVEAAKRLLKSGHEIWFVPKSVCHGFTFTGEDQLPEGAHEGLDLVRQGLRLYQGRPKALHDVLAAVLAIDPGSALWVSGEMYRQRGEWGFRTTPWFHRVAVGIHRGMVEQGMER